ncbi:neuropeptide CCHamide 1 [Megachile rotundata]|uniref:neuropeptide CCHamide 1 n=1 Tax=Megachile rotundata TaxID=143995 RepID=UPI003FD320FC
MAIASENSVPTIIRNFMILFCFIGYAAGSCLSYGHSCWGAHGKRSGGHNNGYVLPLKGMNDMQQGVPLLTKEHLISRLIGRPLMSNKYKGRWDRLFKVKLNYPEHLNDDDVNTRITNELIGDQNNEDIDGGKTKHDVQDMIENLNNEKNEIPKIVLMLRNEEDEQGSKPQNLDFFKFLSDANGNFE